MAATYEATTRLLDDLETGDRKADDLMLQQDQSPAYKALADADLIVNAYRLTSADDLDVLPGNTTVWSNFTRRSVAYTAGVIVGGWVYDAVYRQFSVNAGCVRPAQHTDGSYFFFGPGVHRVNNLFVKLGAEVSLQTRTIEHGNRTIVTVPQGFVGLAFDRGQPVLLAPGLHQWKSDTLRLSEHIDLSADVIRIGPFTLLTVDEGYAAITQDNGKQRILGGGATHMLTHRNWKFEKLISLKIHTDDIASFRATTADNVVLETSAMVSWRVADPDQAARMAADTMADGAGAEPRASTSAARRTTGVGERSVLRRDVLKQATASLAAALGSIRYADDAHVSASEKVSAVKAIQGGASLGEVELAAPLLPQEVANPENGGVSQIFSLQQMSLAVQHANEICTQYGVSIISISVISAVPKDPKLNEALSAGAVAAAGAQQAEIAARGYAKAKLISAQSEAEANHIQAQAMADSERLQAEGKKDAAAMLETSRVAVGLAQLEKTGAVLGNKSTFFFGAGPSELPSLLANPKVVQAEEP